nr:DNA methyltransferase [Dermabacter jinjuensis]
MSPRQSHRLNSIVSVWLARWEPFSAASTFWRRTRTRWHRLCWCKYRLADGLLNAEESGVRPVQPVSTVLTSAFAPKPRGSRRISRNRQTAVDALPCIQSARLCEPALGSGAFAIEAVRQLAEEYLQRRQAELGERIDPEEYPQELQKVKAYIALHNVYGVDLNPTAVELAEVSLWLDSMSSGLKAPWFGLRLRAGNSLIGARRATYAASNVLKAGEKAKKTAHNEGGKVLPLGARARRTRPHRSGCALEGCGPDGSFGSVSGQIFHFLTRPLCARATMGSTFVGALAASDSTTAPPRKI